MFEKRIMADLRGRIDGWWNLSNSTKDDSKRTRVRLRSPNTWLARPDQSRSALFSALDNAFRFIEGMTDKKSKGNCKCRSFASLRMTTLSGLAATLVGLEP
jgi:hypothetical protein